MAHRRGGHRRREVKETAKQDAEKELERNFVAITCHFLLTLNLHAFLRTNSYLLITTSTGCEPTNKLAYVALGKLPRENGTINFASFDLRKNGNELLPIVKLVDNFDASYDCVANEGSVFTFHSNLGAPRYK